MGAPGETAGTQDDLVELKIEPTGKVLTRWLSYSFNSDFMTPTDGWDFVTGGIENPPADELDALVPGARVSLYINGNIQASGYINDISVQSGPRPSGKTIRVEGCDTFGPVVKGGMDPDQFHFTADQTIEDLVREVFGYFNFISFDISDAADRAIKTGLLKARFSKKKGKPLKHYTLANQLKPHPGESAWQYVFRVVTRSGLWVWPSGDGNTVIVDTPDYDQQAVATLTRHYGDNQSNVVSGGIMCRTADQPSGIVATGWTSAGNGEWPRSALKVAMLNELVAYDGTQELSLFAQNAIDILELFDKENPDALLITPRTVFPPNLLRIRTTSQLMFVHDDESRTLQQLESYVRREMSEKQRLMWTGEYVVQGHTFDDGAGNKIPWTVNTIVDVDDDVCEFHGPMWVQGRTFEKSRDQSGTRTRLKLVLPYTIEFGADFEDNSAKPNS